MKHKEKYEKRRRKRIEIDKMDPQSKLKAYGKKIIKVFAFQNQKLIDGSN